LSGAELSTLPEEEKIRILGDLWHDLRSRLGERIDQIAAASPPLRLPLGTWLRDDLLLEAARTSNEVARDGATLVGMPESTFRRRLRSAMDQESSGLATRMEDWDAVRQILAELTRTAQQGEGDLHARTQEVLLQEILSRYPDNTRVGAQLLGVSPPTFRRRAQQLDESS
jgi:CRP-like cAMP-binding protein